MIKLFCFSLLAVAAYKAGHNGVQQHSVLPVADTSGKQFDFSRYELKKLPRPNSGTFSYEEAGKRKNEIYSLQLTPKYFGWKNPTTGGAVHINKRDEAEVYQFTLGIYESRTDSGVNFIPAAKDTFIVVKNIKDLEYHVGGMGFGNAASVLVTSEIDLRKSKIFKEVLEELWEPATQIYYLTKKK